MTDKVLLELAAKAAGIEIVGWVDKGPLNFEYMLWNPLTDDGDALRLAVKLKLTIGCPGVARDDDGRIQLVCEETDADDLSATRRAIVRAAAEIARQAG